MKFFVEIKETKTSLEKTEKERIDLLIKKSFDGWWHCRYKYTSIKNGVEISLSSEYSCKDEHSSVYYAVKAARLDIKSYLNKNLPKYYPQLLNDIYEKYNDRKRLHHKILNRLFCKGNEYFQ